MYDSCCHAKHTLPLPLLLLLPLLQLIHGDANENNIIVDAASQEVAALIDW
jgi:Ser/Thr protein kinase RdoA (MazF antagonist)